MDTPSPANVRIQTALTRGLGATTTPHLGHAMVSIATPPPHARHETRLMLSPSAPIESSLGVSESRGTAGAYRLARDEGAP